MSNAPLIGNDNSPDLQTVNAKALAAFNEAVNLLLDTGQITTFEIADILEREIIPPLRLPFQNAEDNR